MDSFDCIWQLLAPLKTTFPSRDHLPITTRGRASHKTKSNNFYRVSIPRSGIWLQGKRTRWLWPNRETRRRVEAYLQVIQQSREEIRLEVTNYDQIWDK